MAKSVKDTLAGIPDWELSEFTVYYRPTSRTCQGVMETLDERPDMLPVTKRINVDSREFQRPPFLNGIPLIYHHRTGTVVRGESSCVEFLRSLPLASAPAAMGRGGRRAMVTASLYNDGQGDKGGQISAKD
jgi:hypothetical protein